jgi:hypothetical protein
MNRPTHSFAVYRQRILTAAQPALFVLVESTNDTYFWSEIVRPECQRAGIELHVTSAELLSGNSGGKQVLLGFFAYLQEQHSLQSEVDGVRTAAIFLLDKDVDDYLGVLVRSPHIVYTEPYELENYLFIHGDLAQAAAASGSLDAGTVGKHLGDYAEWRCRAAAAWKEWVSLCLLSHSGGFGCCNFERPCSPINRGCRGPVDQGDRSGLSAKEFNKSLKKVVQDVNRIYSEGRFDVLFKGKWYAHFLAEDIGTLAAALGVRYKKNYIQDRLKSTLELTLDCDGAWADALRRPVRCLLGEVFRDSGSSQS